MQGASDDTWSAGGDRAGGRQALSAATSQYRLPTRGGRTLLIVAAVLAGALTAGIVVVLLRLFVFSQAESPAESTSSSGPPPLAILAALGETDERAPPAPMPTGIAPPPGDLAAEPTDEPAPAAAPHEPAAEVPPPAVPPAEGRRESPSAPQLLAVIGDQPPPSRVAAPRRANVRRANVGRPPPSSPEQRSAAALIAEARAALLRGNARECLETVDRALSGGGGSTALRLQGDCHLRDGNRIEAAKAYQRFCRIAPDHPAIGEVRNLVESLGGACP